MMWETSEEIIKVLDTCDLIASITRSSETRTGYHTAYFIHADFENGRSVRVTSVEHARGLIAGLEVMRLKRNEDEQRLMEE